MFSFRDGDHQSVGTLHRMHEVIAAGGGGSVPPMMPPMIAVFPGVSRSRIELIKAGPVQSGHTRSMQLRSPVTVSLSLPCY